MIPGRWRPLPNSPLTSFNKPSITPPLRGSRTSPSRMAKACAVGGSHKASQRRDLVRRRGQAPAKLKAKAAAVGGTAPAPPIRCGVSPAGRRVGPPPARRRASPSRRLPLKGGVILGLHKASCPIPGRDGNQVPGLWCGGCPPGDPNFAKGSLIYGNLSSPAIATGLTRNRQFLYSVMVIVGPEANHGRRDDGWKRSKDGRP